jgi:hypothetical protein
LPPITADDELRARLHDVEDALVERKEAAKLQPVKAAVVSFANSLVEGTTAVVFVGVRNDGTPAGALGDVDDVQKKIRGYLSECYPPLPYQVYALDMDGVPVVAIHVLPSKDKPHFTGKAYVRVGSETVEASAEALAQLLDQRDSLVAALTPFIGKKVTIFAQRQISTGAGTWDGKHRDAILRDVTPHYVRIHYEPSIADEGYSLQRIALEWDFRGGGAGRPLLRVSI